MIYKVLIILMKIRNTIKESKRHSLVSMDPRYARILGRMMNKNLFYFIGIS